MSIPRLTFLYLCAAVAVAIVVHGGTAALGAQFLFAVSLVPGNWQSVGWTAAAVSGLALVAALWPRTRPVITRSIAAVAFVCVVQTAFLTIKTAMPAMGSFHADRLLADLDAWLHLGVDPWRLAMRAGFDLTWFDAIYGTLWAPLAIFLPVLIAVTDGCANRRRRFFLLYLFGWAVVGNALALAGLSAGPVFYDTLHGGARFADLTVALEASRFGETGFGRLQGVLIALYLDGNNAAGTGISAFPSMHVAAATVVALYLGERSRLLVVPGVLFVAAILLLSVVSGYHYAVDGYASIAVVAGAWAALRDPKALALLRRRVASA